MIRLSVGLTALFAVVVTAACGGVNTPPLGVRRPQAAIGPSRQARSRRVRISCRRKLTSLKKRRSKEG